MCGTYACWSRLSSVSLSASWADSACRCDVGPKPVKIMKHSAPGWQSRTYVPGRAHSEPGEGVSPEQCTVLTVKQKGGRKFAVQSAAVLTLPPACSDGPRLPRAKPFPARRPSPASARLPGCPTAAARHRPLLLLLLLPFRSRPPAPGPFPRTGTSPTLTPPAHVWVRMHVCAHARMCE